MPEPIDDEAGGGGEESGAPRANPAAAPGSSGPGEQGYSGAATVGDEGAIAGPESYGDPFGRPDSEGAEGEGADERRDAGGW
ncbi:MAG: hypothetical protein M3314_05485 [Actinomycetota bacterium]|nr:hypothetical protein [Actinomycetota bacterium]